MVIDISKMRKHFSGMKKNWIILGLKSLEKYISLKYYEYFGPKFSASWHLGINACLYWFFFFNQMVIQFLSDDFSMHLYKNWVIWSK